METIRRLNPKDYNNPDEIALYTKIYISSIVIFYGVYLTSHYLLERFFQLGIYKELSKYD